MERYLSYAKLLANLLTKKLAEELLHPYPNSSRKRHYEPNMVKLNQLTGSVRICMYYLLSNSATPSCVLIRYLLLFSFLSVTTGCYMNAGIYNLDPASTGGSPVIKVNNPGGAEFVSSSDQYQTTLINRYKILSSSGSYNRELVNQTPKGYKVYSSVQGALISSQEGVR